MRPFLILAMVLVAGCIGATPKEDETWPYSTTRLHLHNIWYEFLPDERFILHWTIVNAFPEDAKRIRWSAGLSARPTIDDEGDRGSDPHGTSFVLVDLVPAFEPIIASWETRRVAPLDHYFTYAISAGSHFARINYHSSCYRPSDGDVVEEGGYQYRTCAPRYYVNGYASSYLTPSGHRVHWSDPQFQRLVYDCCGVRTLPAYDVFHTLETNRSGLVDLSWRFPAQEGARNATVTVSFTLPTDTIGPGILNVTVLGPDDDTVAAATTLLDPVHLEIPTLRQGTYKVHVDGQLVPYSDVFLTIHVDDGVQERPPARSAPRAG